MPDKFSCGPDEIPPFLLKKFSDFLAYPLSVLFSRSFNSGFIPPEWKVARIVPVHKMGRKDIVSNYRPISMLCSPDKLMETIVSDPLCEYLFANRLISAEQHGFRPKRSTVAQLIETVNDWTFALDCGQNIDVLYVDIAKAFDTVSHVKLLSKISSYGVDGHLYRWMTEYLSNCWQYVSIDGCSSD
jgi:hypothetical protein